MGDRVSGDLMTCESVKGSVQIKILFDFFGCSLFTNLFGAFPERPSSWCTCAKWRKSTWSNSRLDCFGPLWTVCWRYRCCCCSPHRRTWSWSSAAPAPAVGRSVSGCRSRSSNSLAVCRSLCCKTRRRSDLDWYHRAPHRNLVEEKGVREFVWKLWIKSSPSVQWTIPSQNCSLSMQTLLPQASLPVSQIERVVTISGMVSLVPLKVKVGNKIKNENNYSIVTIR